jgi:hypothetical protein
MYGWIQCYDALTSDIWAIHGLLQRVETLGGLGDIENELDQYFNNSDDAHFAKIALGWMQAPIKNAFTPIPCPIRNEIFKYIF